MVIRWPSDGLRRLECLPKVCLTDFPNIDRDLPPPYNGNTSQLFHTFIGKNVGKHGQVDMNGDLEAGLMRFYE